MTSEENIKIEEPTETPAEELQENSSEEVVQAETEEDTPKDAQAENESQDNMEKIRQFTEEDEIKSPSATSLSSILGGDFLTANLIKRQLALIILIAACFIIYINNRYESQAQLIEIDNLKKELDDARFNALTRSSELTAKTRQSYIEDFLRNSQDSLLQISSNSPYVIKMNGESVLPEDNDPILNKVGKTGAKKDSIIDD